MKYSNDKGASKTVQKYSIELLEFINEFAAYIKKIDEKGGLMQHYEKNPESYDLAVKELLEAKELMFKAGNHMLGKGEIHVV